MQPLHHKLPKVAALFDQLREAELSFVIAGGFPRDLANGLTPKDMDICVYGLQDDKTSVVDELESYVRKQFDFLGEYKIRHDRRIYRAFKLCIKGTRLYIDLIIYKSAYQDEQHLMSTMDYNLNAYVFDLLTDKPIFVGQNEGVLSEQREGGCADPKRKVYLAEKARALGWVVPSNLVEKLKEYAK